jgi:peptide/nickel transport system permease protein
MTRISAKYLSRRLIVSYATILVIMTLLFALIRSMPGSFINLMMSPGMTAEQIAALEARWGLNDPLWQQYIRFMFNYQVGNFGWSPTQNVPVWDLIVRRMPRTVILFGSTFIMGYMIGPLVGMYLGWLRGSTRDQAIFTGGLFMYSMPAFWIGWLVIWVFNYQLGWFPSSYLVTKFPEFEWTTWTIITDVLSHLALPVISVTAIAWVGSMLVMRTTMNDVTDSDYVFLAEAKGVPERAIMIKHAARNALIPVATQAIVGIAFILDGAVLIENVFNYPGMGLLLVDAVLNNDYPVTQAVFFVLAVMIVIMRLVTDVAYTYLDPRIKFGEEN